MASKKPIAMIVAGGNSTRNSKYTGNYIPKSLLCISKNGVKSPAIIHTIKTIADQYSKIYIATKTSDYDLFMCVLNQYGLSETVSLIRIDPKYNSKGSAAAIYSAFAKLTEAVKVDETVSVTFIWSDLLINKPLPVKKFDKQSITVGVVDKSVKLCRYEVKDYKLVKTNTLKPTNKQVVGVYHFTKFKPYRYVKFIESEYNILNSEEELDLVEIINEGGLPIAISSMDVGDNVIDFGSSYEYEKACATSDSINGRGDCKIEFTETTCKKHLSAAYDVEALKSWLHRHKDVSPSYTLTTNKDGTSVLEMDKVDKFLIDVINSDDDDQYNYMLINAVLDQLAVLNNVEEDLVQHGLPMTVILSNVMKETSAKIAGRYTKNIQQLIHSLGFDVDKILHRCSILSESIFKYYVYHITKVKIVPIHGDPNFGNVYLDNGVVKYIDPRHGFGTFINNGPAEYDRSKVLYAALGYDNFNQQYPHKPGSTFEPVVKGLLETGCGLEFSKIEKEWALFHMYMLIPLQYYDLVKMADTIMSAEKAFISGKF